MKKLWIKLNYCFWLHKLRHFNRTAERILQENERLIDEIERIIEQALIEEQMEA